MLGSFTKESPEVIPQGPVDFPDNLRIESWSLTYEDVLEASATMYLQLSH